MPSMNNKTINGLRFRSLSWAELGIRFRAARLAGNESLAARLKQAIELKKEIKNGNKGLVTGIRGS